jgi:hypothetical protein
MIENAPALLQITIAIGIGIAIGIVFFAPRRIPFKLLPDRPRCFDSDRRPDSEADTDTDTDSDTDSEAEVLYSIRSHPGQKAGGHDMIEDAIAPARRRGAEG